MGTYTRRSIQLLGDPDQCALVRGAVGPTSEGPWRVLMDSLDGEDNDSKLYGFDGELLSISRRYPLVTFRVWSLLESTPTFDMQVRDFCNGEIKHLSPIREEEIP